MPKTPTEVIAHTQIHNDEIAIAVLPTISKEIVTGFNNADRILAALDAAGFVVVPKEPTEKMLKAAFNDFIGYERQGPQKPPWNGRTMWRAMVAVASTPTEEKG